MRQEVHRLSGTRCLVLGGGVSGLVAARALQAAHRDYELLEMAPALGGLTRSIQADNFCFDYTGHLLHLSKSDTPSGLPYAGLKDRDWERIDRRSFCWIDGRLVTAPIQYNLRELSEPLRTRVAASYERRPRSEDSVGVSFRDALVSGFGRALSDVFLVPQNEKNLAIPLSRLSAAALKRFFPPPDDAKVRAGLVPETVSPATYNSQFWYPKTGGIGRLVEGLARPLKRVSLRQEVAWIDLARRQLGTSSGAVFEWDVLFSSLPLPAFCRMTRDGELARLGRALTHSATISFNIGLRGSVGKVLQEAHWVYTASKDLPFYRVGVYSNISRGACPAGYAALYVEVGASTAALRRIDIERSLFPHVLESLAGLGWIDPKAVACSVINTIGCAYVHFTSEREQALPRIREQLTAAGVHLLGRYGEWDYTSMEDAVYSTDDTVRRAIS